MYVQAECLYIVLCLRLIQCVTQWQNYRSSCWHAVDSDQYAQQNLTMRSLHLPLIWSPFCNVRQGSLSRLWQALQGVPICLLCTSQN